jgi:hypothetical protein
MGWVPVPPPSLFFCQNLLSFELDVGDVRTDKDGSKEKNSNETVVRCNSFPDWKLSCKEY